MAAAIIIVLASVSIAIAYTATREPLYEATSQIFISTEQASTAQDLSSGSTYTQQVVKSYANVALTPIVLGPVIRDLQLGVTSAQLAKSIVTTAPADTQIVQITATWTDATTAAAIANSVSTRLASVVGTLSPSSSSQPAVRVTTIQRAVTPDAPSSPSWSLNIGLGLALGLLVGLSYAALRDRLDTRVRNKEHVAMVTDRPVLGAIAFDPDAATHPLVVQSDPQSARAESFRALRTSLQFLHFKDSNGTMVVTSSVAAEGKSTSACNLAITLAEAGKRTLLVDADLRRPKIAHYLGVDGGVGLADVIIGTSTLEDAVQEWGSDGLRVLPSGTIPPNPSELLQSGQMSDLLGELASEYDAVIFDAPPLLPVTDAAILASQTSGAIVFAAAGRVHRAQLKSAIEILAQVDARILGLMLTMVPSRGADAYGEYRYAYQADQQPKASRWSRRPKAKVATATVTNHVPQT